MFLLNHNYHLIAQNSFEYCDLLYCVIMEWKLTFLGTGAGLPSPVRGASCTALQLQGDVWLFDCGEGSQIQLMRSTVRLGKINRIFITHMHGDHLFGLPGLLCTITQNVALESKPALKIYGPPGLARFLRQSLNLSYSILGYKYEVYELVDEIGSIIYIFSLS